MSRSVKKGPLHCPELLKRVEEMNQSGKKTGSEDLEPQLHHLPCRCGATPSRVYDGRKHVPVYIQEDMVGHKLGEFAPTRTFRGHTRVNKEKENAEYGS